MTRASFISRDKDKGNASYRRSSKQEKSLATASGGRLVPGSGSGRQKGDVMKAWGVIRIEAKTTKNKSFSVTREMVRKIEEAALSNREIPAIVVEFINEQGRPEMEVAIVPTYVLAELGAIHAGTTEETGAEAAPRTNKLVSEGGSRETAKGLRTPKSGGVRTQQRGLRIKSPGR